MYWLKRFLLVIVSFALIIATAIALAVFGLNTYQYYKNTYLFARVLLYIIGGYFALIFISVYLCGCLISMETNSSGEIESEDVEQDIGIVETVEERRSTT